ATFSVMRGRSRSKNGVALRSPMTRASIIFERRMDCRVKPGNDPKKQETALPARDATLPNRMAMYNGNQLKIGVFGANCSSGRSATMVTERWSASWPDCRRLARMAEQAGIGFMLPIARWKGDGGATDFHGTPLATMTRAA